MITGFFILGTAGWAWKRGDRRTKIASTLAVVLLPLQITVGAITVTIGGLVPGGYSPPTHAAHLIVALTIFTLLTLTTLFAVRQHHRRPPRVRSRLAVGVALGALLVSGLFSRGVPLLNYSPGAQAWYYAVSLVAVGALLATVFWLSAVDRIGAWLAGGALGVQFGAMLLGRDLVLYTAAVQRINFALYLLALGIVVAVGWRLRGSMETVPTRQSASSD